MAQAVLFNTKDQVINAYIANNISRWGVFIQKELVCAWEENDMEGGTSALEDCLERMMEGGTDGILFLRVYPPGSGVIKYSTEPLRGFPFRLFSNGAPYRQQGTKVIEQQQRIEQLERALLELQEEREAEEEEGSSNRLMAGVTNFLQHPEMQQMMIAGIRTIVGKITGMTRQPASVAGMPPVSPDASQGDKIDQALDILEAADPLLGDHLLAIAKIAKENPSQYQFLIGMLPK